MSQEIKSSSSAESYLWIKFFSEKEFSPLMLDTPTISIGSLKEKIINHLKHVYRSKSEAFDKMATQKKKKLEIDLNIFNAETKEMYTDDNYIIDAYRRVLLERVPKINTKTTENSEREAKGFRAINMNNSGRSYDSRYEKAYPAQRYERRPPNTTLKRMSENPRTPADFFVISQSKPRLDDLSIHISCKSETEMDVLYSQLNPCLDFLDSNNKFQFNKPKLQSLTGNIAQRGHFVVSKPAFRERSRSKSRELRREY